MTVALQILQSVKKWLRPSSHSSSASQKVQLRAAHARELLQRRQWDSARMVLEALINEQPGNAELHVALGHAYLKLELWTLAVQRYKEGVRLEPRLTDVYANLGLAHYRMANWHEAERAFRCAIEAGHRDAWLECCQGELLTRLGRRNEGIEHYRRAAKTTPQCVAYAVKLAEALSASDQWSEAADSYRDAAAFEPQNVQLLSAYAIALLKNSRWQDAAAVLETAVAIDPACHAAWSLLAKAQLRLEDWQASLASGKRAVSLDPGNREYIESIFWALVGVARWTEAVQFVAAVGTAIAAQVLQPRIAELTTGLDDAEITDPLFMVGLAQCVEAVGSRSVALSLYIRAIVVAPAYAPAYYHLSRMQAEDGEVADALLVCEQALACGLSDEAIQTLKSQLLSGASGRAEAMQPPSPESAPHAHRL